jgi:hypothetical protein
MEKIVITIKTTNAAFEGNEEAEVAKMLRELADKLENGQRPEVLFDLNGNRVGSVSIWEE